MDDFCYDEVEYKASGTER